MSDRPIRYDTEDAVNTIIRRLGDNPEREGLKETAKRVVDSLEELYSGYKQKPNDIIKTFEDVTCDEIVLLKDVEFFSCCEHHMLPFFGKAHIAYIPDGKVIGISKLARLLEIYSRRLQIQERICQQVTQALMDHLKPKAAACILEARHFCLSGNTRIQLAFLDRTKFPRGVKIKNLVGKENLPVYCYDESKRQITVGNVSKVWYSGRKRVYRIHYVWYLRNQYKQEERRGYIDVTKEHPLMLRKGGYLSIGEGLQTGDRLMPFSCYGEPYRILLLNNGHNMHEHRFLLGCKIGRPLTPKEISHHKNEITLDNSFSNLGLIGSRGEHNGLHFKGVERPERRGIPAHNRKGRKIMYCENCNQSFTCQCGLEVVRSNHKIIAIERRGVEDVYDLEVPKFHNFAANEIIVHNCMIARGVNKQNSVMSTSSLQGAFKTDEKARSELMSLIGKG